MPHQLEKRRTAVSASLPEFPWDTLADAKAQASAHRDGIVDLSVGTPVDPVAPLIQEALAAAASASGYPATAGTARLRESAVAALDRRFAITGLTEAAVLPVVGSKELIQGKPAIAESYRKSFTGGANSRGQLRFDFLHLKRIGDRRILFARWNLSGGAKTESGMTTLVFERRANKKEWQELLAGTYKDHVIVCGLGHVGYRVVHQLLRSGAECVAIEQAETAAQTAEPAPAAVPAPEPVSGQLSLDIPPPEAKPVSSDKT